MARFGRTVRDSQGNTIPNATIKVYLAGTLTFASIFSDAALTLTIDQATSPLINEDDGTYEFFVATGTYKIVVSHPSIPTETYDNVDVGFSVPDAFVDVRAHGAVGNGVTDDTAAVNAALAAGAGEIVFLPPGNYRVTSNLTPAAGTWVLGAGMGATTITMDSTAASRRVIHVTVDRVHVSDLKINGGPQTTPIAHQGVALIDADHCIVERVWTVNTGQYGIVVGDSGGDSGKGVGHILRNNFVDMTGTAIASAAPAGIEVFPRGGVGFLADPPVLIEGNTVLGGAVAINGIKCSQNRGARILGNTVTGVTSASATGAITVLQGTDFVISNNTISDTRIGINVSGIVGVGNGVQLSRAVIEGNIVRKFSVAGMFSADGSDRVLISGNIVDVDGGGAADGIRFNCADGGKDYTRLVIDDNQFHGGGIIFRTDPATSTLGAPRVRITDNFIESPAGGFPIGVYLEGSNSVDPVVSGNTIRLAGTTSIDIRNAPRATVECNKILDGNVNNTADIGAIQLVSSVNSRVFQNHAENISGGTGHMKWAVTVNGSSGVSYRDNVFTGMETGEIRTINTVTTAAQRSQQMTVAMTTATGPADTVENTLRSFNVVRGSLTKFGGLRILAAGVVSGTAGAKTIRLKLDTATVATIAFAAAATGEWLIEAEMWVAESEAAQRWSIRGYEATALESTQPDYVTSSVNLSTADRTLALTVQKGDGADVITQTMWRVEVIR